MISDFRRERLSPRLSSKDDIGCNTEEEENDCLGRHEELSDCNYEKRPQSTLEVCENDVDEEDELDLIDIRASNVPFTHDTGTGSQLKLSSWKILWGLLVATGSTKMIRCQYQAMQIAVRGVPKAYCYRMCVLESRYFSL